MNVTENPKTVALAVSIALFALQLVAIGSGAAARSAAACGDAPIPSAITVVPLEPEAPGRIPAPNSSQAVSI